MKTTFVFIIGLIIIAVSCISDRSYQASDCMGGTFEVVSDCANPNAVLCACESIEGKYIYIDQEIHHGEHVILCDSSCEIYKN